MAFMCFLWQVTLPLSAPVLSFVNGDDDACPAHLPYYLVRYSEDQMS